jgi:hypothetical protein
MEQPDVLLSAQAGSRMTLLNSPRVNLLPWLMVQPYHELLAMFRNRQKYSPTSLVILRELKDFSQK